MDYQVLSIEQLVEECAERPTLEAWEEFIRRFNRLIAATVLRTLLACGRSDPELTEDLIQETYLKLCANDRLLLRRFESQHPNSFLGFLKKVTVNLVLDHVRKHFPDDDTDELPDDDHSGGGKDAELLELGIFSNEVNDLLLRRGNGPVEKRERAIFWLKHHHGMTAKEIASIPEIEAKLGIKGVESCLFRLTTYIKECLLTTKTKDK
jgi:RNA polymerase sigma-70 factor (ECF subfamily)